jgi:hypothetical protein
MEFQLSLVYGRELKHMIVGPKKYCTKYPMKFIIYLGRCFNGNLDHISKKSLIISIQYQQTIMIHTKRVIFMILPLLFVPLVYGISSTPDACAAPPDSRWDSSKSCDGLKVQSEGVEVTCCWRERIPGLLLGEEYCQTCEYTANGWECSQKELQFFEQPPTPPTPPRFPGVLGDLPTLEQVPTTPPPLFGRNEGAVPPTGGIEQPFTSIPFQQIPQGTVQGQDQPLIQSETPPTLSPLPTPPPPLPPPTQDS